MRNPTQRVNASEALTSEFGANGRLASEHPNLIVWGESSVADDLTLDHGLLRQIEQLSAQGHAEILASQDSNVPGPSPSPAAAAATATPAAARKRSRCWSARPASRAGT